MLVRNTLIAGVVVAILVFTLISLWPSFLIGALAGGAVVLALVAAAYAKALPKKEPQALPVEASQVDHPVSKKVDEHLSALADARLKLWLEGGEKHGSLLTSLDTAIDRLVYLLGQFRVGDEKSPQVLGEVWTMIQADLGEIGGIVPNIAERLGSLPDRVQELTELHGMLDLTLENPPPGPSRQQAADYLERVRALPPLARAEDVPLDLARDGDYVWVDGELFEVGEVSDYRESYEGKHYVWFETAAVRLRTGERTWIEWEHDDELEVALSEGRLTLADVPVTRADLDRFDDEEEGSFRYEGRTYEYEDSGNASYHRGGKGSGEKLYYYDFATPDGKRSIGIEKWGGEYQVHLSRAVDAKDVQIYRTSGGG